MNKHNAKDYLPIINALARGEKIEFLDKDSKWKRAKEVTFALPPHCYRAWLAENRVPQILHQRDTIRIQRPPCLVEMLTRRMNVWTPVPAYGGEWEDALWAAARSVPINSKLEVLMNGNVDSPCILTQSISHCRHDKGAHRISLNIFNHWLIRFNSMRPDFYFRAKLWDYERQQKPLIPIRQKIEDAVLAASDITVCPNGHGVCFAGCPICRASAADLPVRDYSETKFLNRDEIVKHFGWENGIPAGYAIVCASEPQPAKEP